MDNSHYKVKKTAPNWTEDQDKIIRNFINQYRELEARTRRGEKVRRREEFAEEVLKQYPIIGNHKVKDIAGHFKYISEVLDGKYSVERTLIKYKQLVGAEKIIIIFSDRDFL
ncbi:hypothetical protein [Paenibacillus durus]|uniref:Uncharacterized protein n=1 Tax=Paenibacillus durus TaxID=44251 RepID=A0A089HLK3_PAEDU|nr:hypothetical protein [Paenibacillus durus]AIQ11947.1 hypothetical protein PDUR_08360 [Paenibacillus durus]